MSMLRQCIREEVASRIDILDGHPPESASVYKVRLLRVFVSHGSGVITRRALLSLCPNGEWRSSKVQFYLRHSHQFSRAYSGAIVTHVANGLIVALAAASPHVYNRNRWTGADLAVDDIGIFECVHRLLSTSFARFAARQVGKPQAAQLLLWGKSAAAYDGGGFLEVAAGGDDDVSQPGGEGQPIDAAAGVDAPGTQTSRAQGAEDFAAENTKNRGSALKFLAANPLGWLVVIRLLMEPLRQLLSMQFVRAGEEKAMASAAEAARRCLAGGVPNESFRVAEVASGVDDHKFLASIVVLNNSKELWSVLPPSFQTFAMRGLIWRATSRMACSFVKIMVKAHDSFPIKLFRLLKEPHLHEDFARKECLMDPMELELAEKIRRFQLARILQDVGHSRQVLAG